jgi:hypothetical protein
MTTDVLINVAAVEIRADGPMGAVVVTSPTLDLRDSIAVVGRRRALAMDATWNVLVVNPAFDFTGGVIIRRGDGAPVRIDTQSPVEMASYDNNSKLSVSQLDLIAEIVEIRAQLQDLRKKVGL